jgi:hypothetical protein
VVGVVAWLVALAFWGLVGLVPVVAAEGCSNAVVRGGPSGVLPDCRAYEQVTPVQKGGISITGHVEAMQASVSGDAITFLGSGVPGGVGAQDLPTFLARRVEGEWSSRGVLPPQNCPACADVLGWSEDLTQVYDRSKELTNGSEALLMRDSLTGALSNLTGFAIAAYGYDATSSDGSKVFFEAHTVGTPLTPGAVANGINLYVWDRGTGLLSLVGVLPDGSTPEHGSIGGAYDWLEQFHAEGGSTGFPGGFELQQMHAFSADGSRAYFTEPKSDQIYLRENPGGPGARTVHVSVSEKVNGSGTGGADPNGPKPAAFMRATADGAVALFTSPEELTNSATTGSEDQGNDLYMFNAASGALTDLVVDESDVNGAEVQGVLGMSEDGGYVYFVANGVLAPGATAGTCKGNKEAPPRHISEEGRCNLYVWHEGAIGFIAQLSGSVGLPDRRDWATDPGVLQPPAENHQGARVSSDGRVLLFGSYLPLTGYENQGPPQKEAIFGCGAKESGLSGARCQELYRYEAETKQLTCVSCDPSGGRPDGDARLVPFGEGAESGPVPPAAVDTRNLSSDGRRVFFSSPDQLVPEDVNTRYNAYEWEADGSGSCHGSAQNGGCLFLLTPGGNSSSPSNSYFVDASASGGDAFVLSDQSLVGQDQDALGDIYDVRVGGGIASQSPLAAPAPCASGDECRAGVIGPVPVVPGVTVEGRGVGNFPSAGAAGKLSFGRHSLRGRVLRLRVKVKVAGSIGVRGGDIVPVTQTVAGARTFTLSCLLTRRAARELRLRRHLRVVLAVRFAGVDEAARSAKLSLVF